MCVGGSAVLGVSLGRQLGLALFCSPNWVYCCQSWALAVFSVFTQGVPPGEGDEAPPPPLECVGRGAGEVGPPTTSLLTLSGWVVMMGAQNGVVVVVVVAVPGCLR